MINSELFRDRRKQFVERMQSNSVALLPAAPINKRNGTVYYNYRQNSNFYYLTGFTEPHAVAVFVKGEVDAEYILFNQPHDAAKEKWIGFFAGQDGAVDDYGADQSYSITELDQRIPGFLKGERCLYYPFGCYTDFDQQVNQWINMTKKEISKGINPVNTIINIELLLHEMRLIKNDAEIQLMQQAAKITADAHKKVMQVCHPEMFEYELEAVLNYEYNIRGARAVAFQPIVATGANSCILHYVSNEARLESGGLVLVDSGCEYQYYASDVTRTFPVNGKFTAAQRAIYKLVLETQLATIALIRPGCTFEELQASSSRQLTSGLKNLGLLCGDIDELMEKGAYKAFYMHNIGHWIGIDVHDVGAYKIKDKWREFQPGMVIAIEPGIYIPMRTDIDEKWWNIGVRIEDDVLVTQKGHEVLSRDLPKSIEEIESIVGSAQSA